MGDGTSYTKCDKCLERDYNCKCRPDHHKWSEYYKKEAEAYTSIVDLENQFDLLVEDTRFIMRECEEYFKYSVDGNEYSMYKLWLRVLAYAREIRRRLADFDRSSRNLPRETEVLLYTAVFESDEFALYMAKITEQKAEDTFGIKKAWIEFESDSIVGIRIQPKHRSSETHWRFYYSDTLSFELDAKASDCFPSLTIASSPDYFTYYFPEFQGFRVYGIEAGNDYLTVCLVKYGPNMVSPDFC